MRLATNSPFSTFTSMPNLDVAFDPHLSLHIYTLSCSCFKHIRDLRRILKTHMLDFKSASTIATSIVNSKLGYCNFLFLNLDSTQLKYLQLIQNSNARAAAIS